VFAELKNLTSFCDNTSILLATSIVPNTFKEPPIPTPPETVNAPVVVEPEAVEP